MPQSKKSKIIRLCICAGLLAILIPVGFLTGLLNANSFGNVTVNLSNLFKLLIMIAGVLCAETLLIFIIGAIKVENHRVRSVLSIISSVLKYVSATVIICWGLSIIGVNVSTIVASLGIVALILGFSAESLIEDMVTGAFMVFENQYNVGDIVEVSGFRGTVTNIGLRTTCLTDPGGNVKIVNNSSMKNILNRSDKPSRSACEIAVPYGTDFRKLESEIPGLVQRIFEAHPDVMKAPPVYLGINELADSGVILKFVVEVDESNIFSGSRILNHDLLLGFKDLGVECPFPQVDVHNIPVS
ncbi:MAG: mechanosensitive ion channel [Clostridia bacterium]|nr:mechanosensitive ion channel [Clostridia bacterium]